MKNAMITSAHDTIGFWEAPIVLIQDNVENIRKELSFSVYRIPEMAVLLSKDEENAKSITSEKMVALVELGIFHPTKIGQASISHGEINVAGIAKEYQKPVVKCFFEKGSKPHNVVASYVAVNA